MHEQHARTERMAAIRRGGFSTSPFSMAIRLLREAEIAFGIGRPRYAQYGCLAGRPSYETFQRPCVIDGAITKPRSNSISHDQPRSAFENSQRFHPRDRAVRSMSPRTSARRCHGSLHVGQRTSCCRAHRASQPRDEARAETIRKEHHRFAASGTRVHTLAIRPLRSAAAESASTRTPQMLDDSASSSCTECGSWCDPSPTRPDIGMRISPDPAYRQGRSSPPHSAAACRPCRSSPPGICSS